MQNNCFSPIGAPLGAPRIFLAPFGGLTRFLLHFQGTLSRLEWLKRLKLHRARASPLTVFWLAPRGEPRGGADRFLRSRGGAHPLAPPAGGERRNTGLYHHL